MTALKGVGPIAVAVLAGLAFLQPSSGGWAFAAADMGFVALLWQSVRRSDAQALVAAAQEPLAGDEVDVVTRYAFYFSRPDWARELSSILAALGLASLLLVPWLTYKAQWWPAIAIGGCLFGVARLTKLLSPVYALRMAVSKGDREALRLLSAHDPALRKLCR